MDTESYIQSLLESNSLRESILREMVRAMQFPAGSRGLDAGCGIGLQCLLLAEAVGPSGHVTGLDISAEMLKRGGEMVKEAGLSERISFQEGGWTLRGVLPVWSVKMKSGVLSMTTCGQYTPK